MADRIEVISEMEKPMRMHPQKFALWLFMVSVLMLFGSLTSAYIVRQAEGNWDTFGLPQIFTYSTIVIFLSSITMQWSLVMARKDELGQLRAGIALTSVLGVMFLVMQVMGWGDLVAINVYFTGNPSGTFLYVLSGMHGLHLISGIVFLLIVLVAAFRYQIHSKQMVRMEMCATYWHFLGLLWIMLYCFLLYFSLY